MKLQISMKLEILTFNPRMGKLKIVTRMGKGGGHFDTPLEFFLFANRFVQTLYQIKGLGKYSKLKKKILKKDNF